MEPSDDSPVDIPKDSANKETVKDADNELMIPTEASEERDSNQTTNDNRPSEMMCDDSTGGEDIPDDPNVTRRKEEALKDWNVLMMEHGINVSENQEEEGRMNTSKPAKE